MLHLPVPLQWDLSPSLSLYRVTTDTVLLFDIRDSILVEYNSAIGITGITDYLVYGSGVLRDILHY